MELTDIKKNDKPTGDQSEVRRLSLTPQMKRRSSPTLNAFSDIDLTELSLLDVFTQAATNVLSSIPAQRCIVYIYDKTANVLRPQVVVNYNATDSNETPETTSSNETSHLTAATTDSVNSVANVENIVSKLQLIGFPPVMGMVSSCFLQRCCMRMQEPIAHRAFNREYDAPKDMQVDSILCAPVILYRRVAAVIQLINRVDLTVDRIVVEETERAAIPHDTRNEFSSEVKLQRPKTTKAIVKIGFSIKDEKKLLHFATHVAQAIETNTKTLANAKRRESKAKQALDLLNALNGQRIDSTEMLMPTEVVEHMSHNVNMCPANVTRIPSQKKVITDQLGTLTVIMRLQAMFRGRRQRRAEKFADELAKFGRPCEQQRNVIVKQRMVQTPEKAKSRVHEKPRSPQVNHIEKSRHSPRVRAKKLKKLSPSPTKLSPRTSSPPQVHQKIPQSSTTEPTRTQQRRKSAKTIQTAVRRHQKRRLITRQLEAEKVSKEISSAVKLQSFIRGNLVRKRLRHVVLTPHVPHIVCLRVASSRAIVSNQTTHNYPRSMQLRSQTCVYAMPERPSKTLLLLRRKSQEERNDHQEMPTKAPKFRSVAIESRKLIAIQRADDSYRLVKSPVSRLRPNWNHLVSSVVYEPPGLELSPPGVEFARHRQPIVYQEPEKMTLLRIATETNQSITLDKLSVRLPALATQIRRDQAKRSLLCCLLPSQTKTPTSEPIPVRPIVSKGRKQFNAKLRQSLLKAVAVNVEANLVDRERWAANE